MTQPTQSAIQSALSELRSPAHDPSICPWLNDHYDTIRTVLEQSLWHDISEAPKDEQFLAFRKGLKPDMHVVNKIDNGKFWNGSVVIPADYFDYFRLPPAPPEIV